MTWADALPNLLIGLREGLEAGLVVSILLAAIRKADPGDRAAVSAVWLGVAGAVSLAASFAAVLTFTTAELSSSAQDAVGGGLSVVAVGLVTVMIFWMRRSGAALSAQLRGDVARALHVGVGALALTAFLAVGREGLETTLFLWTAVRASGSTVAPLLGAATGLALAVTLAVLLYRRAVRFNLGTLFNRTAVLLIVIAAGVLAYGLGDLQDAGLIPGRRWVAFDLTSRVDPGAWWVALASGVTELQLRMTVLQVAAWVVYLGVVLTLFVTATRTAPGPRPATAQPVETPSSAGLWERLAGEHRWTVGTALVAAPVAVAGMVIALLPGAAAATTAQVSVSDTSCAPEWTATRPGTLTFAVANETSRAGEVDLDNAAGAVVAEIETLGPATTAEMTARLGSGTFQFHCLMGSGDSSGPQVTVTGGATNAAVAPVEVRDLRPANDAYRGFAARQLKDLSTRLSAIRGDLARGSRRSAERDWLSAQLDWERVGASYDSFGELGLAVDGLPGGLTKGVHDPRFTGLHRLELGLYHRQSPTSLIAVDRALSTAVTRVRAHLDSDALAGDPTNLPVRAHEILEDALRDHLSGMDDEGADAAYPMTYADTQVTRYVLNHLAPLIRARRPGLPATLERELSRLQRALLATRVAGHWRPSTAVPLATRQRIDAALGLVLQHLAEVPDLLEVPPSH